MEGFLLFFDISTGELLIILVVAFLVFGPKKLPEMARKVGQGLNELRRATDEIKKEINKETSEIKKAIDPDEKKVSDNKPSEEPRDKPANDFI